ncbi:repeat, PH and SEC7 domain containing secG-like isoform X17 [Octopus vulgaris]|uniref:Repeat, PH and SEC7 domain containing secG-like isoform X17 n=1 Tax=Octopus vulgaris TaxID=6645 RepID=A0AA36C2P9_OCTVU|nr:repeat, PH and SEC7 domain containing secG-like isoform X17 [Octopus vulgaris]
MAACEQGSTSLIAFLIESGANMDMSDKAGLTALHYAVISRKIDAVASLVSRGANVNKQDSWGNTPLHWAVWNNYEDVVKVLLSSKGNNTLQVTQRNNKGWTPLHLASYYGHTDTAKLLLQQDGADATLWCGIVDAGPGRELGIKQHDLDIIKLDHSHSVREQSFQMLLTWFQSCDPAKRTLQILKEALERTECFIAIECLSSEFNRISL